MVPGADGAHAGDSADAVDSGLRTADLRDSPMLPISTRCSPGSRRSVRTLQLGRSARSAGFGPSVLAHGRRPRSPARFDEQRSRDDEQRQREDEARAARRRREAARRRSEAARGRTPQRIDESYQRGQESLERRAWRAPRIRSRASSRPKLDAVDAALYWKAYALDKLNQQADCARGVQDLIKRYPAEPLDCPTPRRSSSRCARTPAQSPRPRTNRMKS
jgi:hypothetical protein